MYQKGEIRIGTRESDLAVWQANHVLELLRDNGFRSQLVYIRSEGDVNQHTPLYEMGVQGIFTKALDIALLENRIDIAVHSMKDVPTKLPQGISQVAVLKRGNHKDLFAPHPLLLSEAESDTEEVFTLQNILEAEPAVFSLAKIGTSSVRRKAQWLNRYPNHEMVNLRGNVNTRLEKLYASDWQGAIFAAAGLERIGLRPADAIDIDWMLPAPAQGAIMVACRSNDNEILNAVQPLNDKPTAACTKIERDFLKELMGGCSTPISALAQYDGDEIYFRGNILTTDGKQKVEIEKYTSVNAIDNFGKWIAKQLLDNGGREIAESLA